MPSKLDITLFRLKNSGIRKVLGNLEEEIMELLWMRPAGQATTVRDVFEELSQRRRIAYTTVMSTMTRLAKKNLLQVEKQEIIYTYIPTMTRQEFISYFVSHILEDLFASFPEITREQARALTRG